MKLYLWSGVLIIILTVLASYQTVKEISCKFLGEEILAEIIETSTFCKKGNNRIEIRYKSKFYSVLIGRSSCVNKKFRKGKFEQFRYSRKFDHIITTKSSPEIMIPLLIGMFGLGLYGIMKSKKKNT